VTSLLLSQLPGWARQSQLHPEPLSSHVPVASLVSIELSSPCSLPAWVLACVQLLGEGGLHPHQPCGGWHPPRAGMGGPHAAWQQPVSSLARRLAHSLAHSLAHRLIHSLAHMTCFFCPCPRPSLHSCPCCCPCGLSDISWYVQICLSHFTSPTHEGREATQPCGLRPSWTGRWTWSARHG